MVAYTGMSQFYTAKVRRAGDTDGPTISMGAYVTISEGISKHLGLESDRVQVPFQHLLFDPMSRCSVADKLRKRKYLDYESHKDTIFVGAFD